MIRSPADAPPSFARRRPLRAAVFRNRALRAAVGGALLVPAFAVGSAWVELDPFDAGLPVCRRFEDVDGLPQNTVHALLVDREGFVWAGTQDGAAFYDGQTWHGVELPDPLRSNFVRSMLQTKNGDLWIGSQAGGLFRRRDGAWRQFEPGDSGLPDDRVNVLLESERDTGESEIWIGTHEGGVVRYDGENWTVYSSAAGLPSSQVWDLLLTGAGADRTLWIATGAGPATLRLADGEVAIPAGAPSASVSSLIESTAADGRRVMNVGTYGQGLWRFAGGQWSRIDRDGGLPSSFLTDLAPSPSRGGDAFWIASDGGGIALLDEGVIRAIDLGATLSSRAVYKILETTAAEGGRAVWLGTRNNGVLRMVDGFWRGFQPFPETPNVPVNALLLRREAGGRASLWLGTDGYGLAVRRHGEWSRIDVASGALGNDTVTAIAETRAVGGRSALWVGTRNGGLARLEGERWSRFDSAGGALPNDTVQALVEGIDDHGRGTLWIGTREGLVAFDGERFRRAGESGPYPNEAVTSLAAVRAPDGALEIWVGTVEGLWRHRGSGWKKWDRRDGLHNPSVQALHFESSAGGERTVWIGSDGGGVYLLDPDAPGTTARTLADAGLPPVPNGSIYSILRDAEGRIYVLTNRGVSRLTRSPGGGEPARLEQFTSEHGLPLNQGNRGAGFVDDRGRLWIGTVGGAAAFDPALEPDDRTPKRLHVRVTPASCQDCDAFDGQLFAHDENRFRFRFQLLSYFAEPLLRYRTELVGHDVAPGEWTRAAEREVGALPPGRYLLRAWGRDATGVVSGPVEFAFAVRPAPWQTPWAWALGAALLAAIAGLLWRARSLAQARRERALEEQVAARTRRLQRANALLVELSYLDALTSVPNRRRFDELFALEWQRSLRSQAPLGLVIIDIDEFKKFNDTYGHQEGDEALRLVATALADGLARSGDAIARYGGEEFAVLLPSTDAAGAARFAEQLRRRVEDLALRHEASERRKILTVSCGAVAMVGSLDREHGELFRLADEALYRAKRAGGNQTASG